MTADVFRVGMVGYAFMGAAHAQGWRNAPRFFHLPIKPELTAVAGRTPEAVRAAGTTVCGCSGCLAQSRTAPPTIPPGPPSD